MANVKTLPSRYFLDASDGIDIWQIAEEKATSGDFGASKLKAGCCRGLCCTREMADIHDKNQGQKYD